jgi:hypothetical protein
MADTTSSCWRFRNTPELVRSLRAGSAATRGNHGTHKVSVAGGMHDMLCSCQWGGSALRMLLRHDAEAVAWESTVSGPASRVWCCVCLSTQQPQRKQGTEHLLAGHKVPCVAVHHS